MARRVFYSFHYEADNWRAAQVRNIGVVEGNQPAKDNDWETVKRGGDRAIEQWILGQMKGRSCTVVLIGEETADREWIRYEIQEAWNRGLGVVGINIHGLLDQDGRESQKGENPFDNFAFANSGVPLSKVVRRVNPAGRTSRERYGWLVKHLEDIVKRAVSERKKYREKTSNRSLWSDIWYYIK